jgi:hypothetical protein
LRIQRAAPDGKEATGDRRHIKPRQSPLKVAAVPDRAQGLRLMRCSLARGRGAVATPH